MSEDFVRSRGLLRLGDRYLKEGSAQKAVECYQKALECYPVPEHRHYRIVVRRLAEGLRVGEETVEKWKASGNLGWKSKEQLRELGLLQEKRKPWWKFWG